MRMVIPFLVLLAACTQATEERPDEVRPVRVIKIGVTEGARSVEYAGEVRARYETRLAFRVALRAIHLMRCRILTVRECRRQTSRCARIALLRRMVLREPSA